MVNDPVEYMSNKENYASEKEDAFFNLLEKEDFYVHVEDKGKEAFYELLFKKLYPKLKIKIYANYNGRNDLLKNYYEKKINGLLLNNKNSKEYYLFDRDYECFIPNKTYRYFNNCTFRELCLESQIIILKKTNLENYFLNKETFKEAFQVVSSFSNKELEKFSQTYDKIVKLTGKLSKYYLLNSYFQKSLEKKVIQYIDFDNFKLTPLFYKMIGEIKKVMIENNEKITKSLYKSLDIDLKKDIDGKETHIALTYACKKLKKNCNKPFKNEDILRTQILNLTDKQKQELRNDIPIL